MIILNDDSISWKAKGIYFYISTTANMLSLNFLQEISSDGISSTQKGINELIKNNYIERVAVRKVLPNKRNVLSHYEYNILK